MPPAKPVNLLSLDGGGIRGVSELIILDEIMKRLQHDLKLPELPRPCDYFQLIGGTSTGGLIALMLGRFRMTTDEALRAYTELAGLVFSQTKTFGGNGRFKASNLEKAIKSIVESRGSSKDPDERMIPPGQTDQPTCGAFVCAVPSLNLAHTRRFRTYVARNNASSNCKIWEAARATSAAPTFFKSITISEPGHGEETFVDGGIKCNNPIWEVVREAQDVFGDDRHVGCILSLGTGHHGTIGFPEPNNFQNVLPTDLILALQKLATNCEEKAHEFQYRFRNAPNLYFRFSAQHGMEGIWLQEWEKMGQVTTHTRAYLQDQNESVNSVVRVLKDWNEASSTPSGFTLAQISGDVIPNPPKPTPKSWPSFKRIFSGSGAYSEKLEVQVSERERRKKRGLFYCF